LRWRTPFVLALSGIFVVLIVGASTFLLAKRASQHTTDETAASAGASAGSSQVKPVGIAFEPNVTITPVEIEAPPTAPPSKLFANPNQPAYDPTKGFAPDARRVLDLASLQLSLERYRKAKGHYPATLDALFPNFAPSDDSGHPLQSPPTDPATHHPYDYQPSSDGTSFRLTGIMDSGARYTVTGP
jgi:hypothetical protein